MHRLLIDIGNTRVKWQVEQAGCLIDEMQALDYKQPQFAIILKQYWRDFPHAPAECVMASVAGDHIIEQIRSVLNDLWQSLPVLEAKSVAQHAGVMNAYSHPETLGVDRWLTLLASHRYYPGNICIVDCGSAVTIDYLAANGQHQGGLIAPGVQMMKQSLNTGTASLPADHKQREVTIADNTESAIHSGCVLAVTALIKQASHYKEQEYQLVLTGGDARMIAEQFSETIILDPNLVMRGLQVLCCEENKL